MTEYYANKLEQGLEYQDFIMDLLLREKGVAIGGYASRRYQKNKGETAQGVEIKHDDNYEKTGNLYIEISEKSNPANAQYVASGIYREDNTWLWVIGNYQDVFVFSKKFLVKMHEGKKYDRVVETPTSRGMLVPSKIAHAYCILYIPIEK